MAIELANPSDGLIEVDEDSFQEEGVSYNFRELMDAIYQPPQDYILTIPFEDLEPLKAGLIARKSKDNFKLKSSGLLTDGLVLAFLHYPHKDSEGNEVAGTLDVRVKLRPKKSVTIIKIQTPGDL